MTRTYATLGSDGRLSQQKLAGPSGYPAAVIATSPVSYWRVGEASGTVASDEMGAHVGTYINAPTLGVAGLLVGDGNTAMACNGWASGMTFACPPLSVWSVGLWAKAASPAGASYERMFGTVGDRFDIAHDDTGNAIKHYTAGTGWVNTSTLAAGETAMFVYTFDGTNLTLYKNGLSVYTVVAGTTLLANTASFGTTPAGTDGTTCTIDEPALWNRALTAAECVALYAAGAIVQFTPASTTAFRLSTYRDVYLIVPVTFNPTAIATATCLVEISPDNATWTTIVTKTAPMLAALAGSIDTVDALVPAGWYVRLTTTLATLGAATWY